MFNNSERVIDKLEAAIEAANRIQQVNSNAQNITDTIAKFDGLKGEVEILVIDVNKAGRLLTRHVLIFCAGCFLITAAAGFFAGYYAFTKSFENTVIQTTLNNLAEKDIEFSQKHQNFNKALQAGVEFYSNALVLPKNVAININEQGQTGYWYTN